MVRFAVRRPKAVLKNNNIYLRVKNKSILLSSRVNWRRGEVNQLDTFLWFFILFFAIQFLFIEVSFISKSLSSIAWRKNKDWSRTVSVGRGYWSIKREVHH